MFFRTHNGKKKVDRVDDLICTSAKRGPKLLRPRASRACQYCRSRKVRCDWAVTADPCTNCRLDDRTCIALPRKRTVTQPGRPGIKRVSRTKPAVRGIALAPPSPSLSIASEKSQSTLVDDRTTPERMEQDLDGMSPNDSGSSSPLHSLPGRPRSLDWSFPQSSAISSRESPISTASVSPRAVSFDTTWNPRNSYHMAQTSFSPSTLPPYIHALPSSVTSEDTEYLSTKGVFEIPERSLRNALLRKYVDCVHPFLPILDLESFLQPIQTGSASGSLSLLLFQSVMSAAVPFLDTLVLEAAGLDRKSIQKQYLDRARFLYEFDTEQDNFVLVQALLLLSHGNDSPSHVKDSWHWLNLSISTARRLGLHLDPQTLDFDFKTTGLRKRIWWSCYMRDRIIALSMRRPLLIQDDDCNVPMLELQDFETDVLSPGILRLLGVGSSAGEVSRRGQLAVTCIEKAKLCCCISQILLAQYTVQSRSFSGGRTDATATLVPKKTASDVTEVMKCGEQLNDWYKQLPEEARYRSKIRKGTKSQGVTMVHLATLSMIYFASSGALYRPHILPSQPFRSFPELSSLSRQKVHDSAFEITRIAQDLNELDLACYLPSTSVTALLPAAFNHLFESRSLDPSARESSSLKSSQCIQILQKIGERHAIAEQAAIFLVSVVRRASTPSLAAHFSSSSPLSSTRTDVNEPTFTFPDTRRPSFAQTMFSSSSSISSDELWHCPTMTLSSTSQSEDELLSEGEEFPFLETGETGSKGRDGREIEVDFDSWIELDAEELKSACGVIAVAA